MSLARGRISLLVLLICGFKFGSAFKIPAPVIEINDNGFKVQIQGSPGIDLFTFHGRVNRELKLNEPGELHGEVTQQSRDGTWTYLNTNRQFVVGDVIYYWIYVQYNGLGYRLENQKFTVREFNKAVQTNIVYKEESLPPPPKCELSETRVNGEFVCRGSVVFEDNFDSVDFSTWEPTTKFSSDSEDAEFNSYQNRSENYYVRNSVLVIAPSLQTAVPGFDERRMKLGTLDFGRMCTADLPYSKPRDCRRDARNGYILPPVVSARLRTRQKLKFRYGEVTVRAKLPIGDWLLPQLLLLPGDKVYESESYSAGYSSGEIRIGFARGNDRLTNNGTEDIDGTQLMGGLILAPTHKHRNKWTRTKVAPMHWGHEFHNYTVRWTPNSISFSVDGAIYANFRDPFCSNAALCADISHSSNWQKGLDLAPFDQDFYIALGLGVGGLGDFPDGALTGRKQSVKPWENTDPQAERSFFENQATWFPTWTDQSVLQVDHIKVTAL